MEESNGHKPPGLFRLVRQLASTSLGILQNRGELLAVEWQEERARLAELMWRALGFICLAMLTAVMVTATVILIFPEEKRVYVAAAFAVLYLAGAIVAWFGIRAQLKHESFSESIKQVKKDREWIESIK
ncbi:MAG: hypothetical protein C5B50_22750 [Verrucomicrobia bacterium]|nr:MAG: hypothetical protein C5B50_22750 [Verrucomicrobiota bacterium]